MAKRSRVIHEYTLIGVTTSHTAINSSNESPGTVLNYELYDLIQLQKILAAYTSMHVCIFNITC